MAVDDPPLVALDANVFDAIGTDRGDLAKTFRRLAETGRLRLFVPTGVATEVSHPDAPPGVRGAAAVVPPIRPRPRVSAAQHIDRIRVRAIMRGDGRPGKHDADASHLSEAAEAGCRYFVTADGKILRKRDTLRSALPRDLSIVTLADLVATIGEDR